MKFFLDSAITSEISYALDMWNLDGVTTNPRHVQASGKPFMAVIRKIAALFEAPTSGSRLRSIRISPIGTTWWPKVRSWRRSAQLRHQASRDRSGFKSVAVLAGKGIRTNLTLVFSPSQALQAMRMGAAFVSPFIGWKESNGEETARFIQEVAAIRDNYGFETEIIVAAVRTDTRSPIRGRRRRHRDRRAGRVQRCLRSPLHRQGAEAVPGFLGSDEVRVTWCVVRGA